MNNQKKAFNCNVKVVDMMMGSGKTSSAINYINNSNDDNRFLFITPYLSEVERIKKSCEKKNFKEPKTYGTKLNGIKFLLSKGENVISTHALFQNFDKELIDICRAKNYTLVMDEVTDVISRYDISKEDFKIMKENFVDINEKTGLITWRNSEDDYKGKFSNEKRLCELGCLAYYGGYVMMWLFPIEVFNSFRNIYILTYMFKSQIQCYYYDYYQLPYEYIYISGDNVNNYQFTDDKTKMQKQKYDFSKLIHILEDEKLNQIGDREYDLSKAWFIRNRNNIIMKQLKNNILNFFTNKRKTKTEFNLWTSFKEFKPLLSGKGYGRGFIPLNSRASNEYQQKISIVYPVNRYINTGVENFFKIHNIEVDEEGYALSEMLQFIWRSAIRKGEEIWIYIPSVRMRELLKTWIKKNPKSE